MIDALFDFCGRGTSTPGSDFTVGGRCEAPVTDKARCIAAAEGTEGMFEPATPGVRPGLRSWLFFLDRVARGRAVFVGFRGGRVGDPSREVWGEAVADKGGMAIVES